MSTRDRAREIAVEQLEVLRADSGLTKRERLRVLTQAVRLAASMPAAAPHLGNPTMETGPAALAREAAAGTGRSLPRAERPEGFERAGTGVPGGPANGGSWHEDSVSEAPEGEADNRPA